MWLTAALLLLSSIHGGIASTCDFPQSLCFDSESALANLTLLEIALSGIGTAPSVSTKPDDLITLINQITSKLKETEGFVPSSYKTCADVPAGSPSGVYQLRGEFATSLSAYCDMNYSGGGWLVLQNRFNGLTNFYRPWSEYQNGFGDLKNGGEFWWGLNNLYRMTNLAPHELAIILQDFDGNVVEARYTAFQIGDESELYRLNVLGTYNGTAGDSLSRHLYMQFTTTDRDNDKYPANCAVQHTGAWWYKDCADSNLNGQYLGGPTNQYGKGMSWKSFRELAYSLKTSKMMIRRLP